MLPTDRTTVVFESSRVQIRAYGCNVACRPRPTERVAGWSAVLVMRQGRFLRRINDNIHVVDTHRAMLFNANQPYEVWHPDREGDAITEFVLDSELLTEIAEAVDPDPSNADDRPFRRFAAPIDGRDCLFHFNVWRSAALGTPDPLEIEESAIRFVAHAIGRSLGVHIPERTRGKADTRRAHADLAVETSLQLNRRFRERLGLSDLAEELDVSPWHLCRVFRAQTGLTIQQYLNGLRLRAALPHLCNPRTTLGVLALDLGFSDQSHFTNAFRREFGISPSRVRRGDEPDLTRRLSKILQELPPAA